ncbi:uncharacterized protein B0T15DRAFT_541067 [Chaetomium strumarium]|uniref:Zn(2)-C6 fungal-type domain-containing protein n=1 Tax=Chaetomium strumarium TaxID=1170767 RepID=A0AAJ0GPG6_9PEZI|nr:hypothetical protein B0T15DRAFT_541067 [Chaetomium strumarium]
MDRRRRAPAKTSTYGQACLQCFKAKCRCEPNPAAGPCERCLRLGKDCQPSDAARRRSAQKAGAPDARIAQLEGKVDTLLSALQAVVNPFGSPAGVLRQLREQGMLDSGASSEDATPTNSVGTSTGSDPAIGTRPTPTSPTRGSPTALPYFKRDIPPYPSIWPTEADAERSLAFFRSEMLPNFPFLNLAPTITVTQLRRDRPVLFQAIITVTTFSTRTRTPRIEALKETIFTSAFVETQSDIDLLLAVLTYIAWSTDAFLGRADLLSRLMVLAISLVYDLRLFKPPRPDVQAIVAYTQGFPEKDQRPSEEDTVHGFMERQRALLACFLLSSHISSHFGRIDALRWSPQLEEALQVIASNRSCPTDKILAYQVRLQLLAHRASQVREQHEADHRSRAASSGTAASTGATSAAAALLYLNTLRAELQALKDSLNLVDPQGECSAENAGTAHYTQTPPPLHSSKTGIPHPILATYADYVQVYLDQSALSMLSVSTAGQPQSQQPNPPPLSTSGTPAGVALVPGFERLECFWRSVEGIKSWLDHFSSSSSSRFPPPKCVGLPSHFWAQAIWCSAILKHLSTHPDPALDCRAVRHRVDLLSTLDWMVVKLDMVSDEADRAGSSSASSSGGGGGGGVGDLQSSSRGDNLFKVFARLFGRARVWAEARWDVVVPSQGQGGYVLVQGQDPCQPHHEADEDGRVTGMDSGVPDVEDLSWMHAMDLDNDKWLEDVLGWTPANV